MFKNGGAYFEINKPRAGSNFMNGKKNNSLDKTRAFWAQEEERHLGRGIHWTDLKAVQHRTAAKISGIPEIGWPQYVAENHLKGMIPVERCLSLCCGKGQLERDLVNANFCHSFDGIDISDGCLEHARKRARQENFENIRYQCQDINQIKLPERTYDLTIAISALHHIKELEHVYKEISRALKKDGKLVVLDYVGPTRFQFGQRQREIIDAVFQLIPESLRRIVTVAPTDSKNSDLESFQLVQDPVKESSYIRWVRKRHLFQKLKKSRIIQKIRGVKEDLSYKQRVHFPTVNEIVRVDPSEAVRSAEVVPVLKKYFHIESFKPLGGALLHFLLYQISGNFDSGNPLGSKFLDLLFKIEDLLMESGDLNSDLVFLIASPKK